jgi:RNA polymerase sigma factor (sigma-70 family)
MPDAPLAAVLRYARGLADRYREETDGALLRHFVAENDEWAFAEIVRRHGPLVMGVCRRVLRHHQDAEDAFQAVFLALAQRAASVRKHQSLGAWLHGAAHRTAKVAARAAARRRRHELGAEPMREKAQGVDAAIREAIALLDEAVQTLPDACRGAFVLCCLEHRSTAEAARALGASEGAVRTRLSRARTLLRRALEARGVGLPAVLAAAALAHRGAGAAVPAALASSTARLATLLAAGGDAAGAVSVRVAALMKGVKTAMISTRLTAATLVALAAVLGAIGPVGTAADRPDDPKQPVAAPGPAGAVPGGRLLLMREGGFTVLAPDGKELAAVTIGPRIDVPGEGRLSPDGKRVAYLVNVNGAGEGTARTTRVAVRDLDGGKFATTTTIDVDAEDLCWVPDGRSLVATTCEPGEGKPLRAEHVRIDLATRTVSKLPWPPDLVPVDWSADGKSVVVDRDGPTPATRRLALMTADGKRVTDLTAYDAGTWGGVARLSPDGKKLLYSDVPPDVQDDHHGMTRRLYVLDVATRKKAEVAGVPLNATVFWCCWSPDGKRIAYTWRQRHAELAKKETLSDEDAAIETEMFLIVAAADGSNAKTVASVKTNDARGMPFEAIDWR